MSSNQGSSSAWSNPNKPSEYVGTAPLTAEEQQFLQNNWGNEFKFLRLYQLSIYKEDDREEGRAILRAFKQHNAQK